MVKVITYGTYDLLHRGHIRLMERAKALGDYLIVGVTADDFDKSRGKINVKQTLMERIEAVRETGLADEIIVEEYEGQKIDDIRRLNVDIFTVGSDWIGKFDYLSKFCKVVYLDRTEGISSSEIRSSTKPIRLGLVGESAFLEKFARECRFVNGVQLAGICSRNKQLVEACFSDLPCKTDDYSELLGNADAVYMISHPRCHKERIKQALLAGKHVLCVSPIALHVEDYKELIALAREKQCSLMEGLKTAYATAYARMLLLVKSGIVGKVVSVDSTCTSMREAALDAANVQEDRWAGMQTWGPTALLPVFHILGTEYTDKRIVSLGSGVDQVKTIFTKIDFVYKDAVASIKVGTGMKSEGELIVSGTKGYIYVPAPWWKTDYFEARFEHEEDRKRYFYQLEGEGIRYEIVAFLQSIRSGKQDLHIEGDVSRAIVSIMEDAAAVKPVVIRV